MKKSLLIASVILTVYMMLNGHALGAPMVVDPTRFRIELYADFGILPNNPRAFQLLLSNGENGFQRGLYVSSDFDTVSAGQSNSARLTSPILRVDGPNQVSIVRDGFSSTQGLLFAQGAYGAGMLVSVPIPDLEIQRLLPDGTVTTFASLGTAPFGPSDMTYFQGSLLVSDAVGGRLLLVAPDGTSSVFALIPLSIPPPDFVSLAEGVLTLSSSAAAEFGGPLLATSLTTPLVAPVFSPFQDSIYVVSADGLTVTPIATGLDAPLSLTEGPGGDFGLNVFVSRFGNQLDSGQVSILNPDGSITPFVVGLNATDVVFDTQGILGGGMFIAAKPATPGAELPGQIWRVTVIPEPSTFLLLGSGTLYLLGYTWRRRRQRKT
jgi:hypothetical protein